jgi:SAM-dependent methyltransferase
MTLPYAGPVIVSHPSSCIFYHSMDLPGYGVIDGHWDLLGRFDEYIGAMYLSGKRVLDVGTASGFLTFEAEKRGAEVVSFDADTADRYNKLPFRNNLYYKDRGEWLRGANDFLYRIKGSYWLSHRLLKSQARACYGDVYNIPAELGLFDIVIVGQILVHLRDGISALASIASRCRDTLIIIEGMLDADNPMAALVGRANNPQLDYAFWRYSVGFYREVLGMLGFRMVSVTRAMYKCNLAEAPKNMELTTIISKLT